MIKNPALQCLRDWRASDYSPIRLKRRPFDLTGTSRLVEPSRGACPERSRKDVHLTQRARPFRCAFLRQQKPQ
ncbi:MAG: hypothetical protein DMF25_06895 [Verrucomicrobia bacterium]|nr:MAG: hypothetical protein DMF25_06895 [Verrucomicrobiota bacterium]